MSETIPSLTPSQTLSPAVSLRPALSVVIPVYNEEENLEALHESLAAALRDHRGGYEAILVDDGSRDRSFALLQEIARRDPEHVVVLRLRRNSGQTAAMAAGFAEARDFLE